MSTLLAQLWNGPSPAPADFNEYAARVLLAESAPLVEYRAAARRWPEIRAASASIARLLMPRVDYPLENTMRRLHETLDPADVAGVDAAIKEQMFQEFRQRALSQRWEPFNDPNNVAITKLETEFLNLKANVETAILAPMGERARNEIARIEPHETARMHARAKAEVANCGIDDGVILVPQKSPIIAQWERLEKNIAQTLGIYRGRGGEANWWTATLALLNPLVSALPVTVAGS